MAMSRAFMYFVRRRHLLSYTMPMISSKTIVCFPYSTSQPTYLSKQSLTKSEKSETDNKVQVDFVEVVKDKTTFAWHLIVLVIGLSGAGIMFYYVFKELFSSNSPNSVYSKAYKKIKNDPRVIDTFGLPIKAYGEETSRGRRAHVRNIVYMKNGVEHMKMKFYIQGEHRKGSVHLEVQKNSDGNWDYRYLFIQLRNRPKSVIVLEDNRGIENTVYNDSKDSEELMPPNFNKLIE